MVISRKKIVPIAAISIVSIISGLSAGVFFGQPDSFSNDIRRIVACTERDNSLVCMRPLVKDVLLAHSAADTIDAIAVANIPPDACHYVAHMVGQETYRTYRDSAISLSECSRSCGSGCIHGAIGEAFSEEAGFSGSEIDFAHLSEEEVLGVGRRLCHTSSTCHGVGHALMQSSGGGLTGIGKALPLCRLITSGPRTEDCYSGVFMEYADDLASRSIFQISSAPSMYPEVNQLPAFCNRSRLEETRACYLYFPTVMRFVLKADGADASPSEAANRLEEICTSQQDADDKTACVLGFGAAYVRSVFVDTPQAVQMCERFDDFLDIKVCVLGAVSMASEYNMPEKTISFCSAVSNGAVRAACYQAAFSRIFHGGDSVEKAVQYCPSNDSSCTQQAQNYMWDPYEALYSE